ncbi:hypothetical protein V3Q90_15810 [Flavobacterium oreochromis]|uniref:Competence protein n=1 Tax=Flavobacterium oreochromis TaxID=2906078 RepID=A0ABW8PCC3_9FLAO|nr:hypothetical protein [Flavobacterium oreochromis]OWP74113.1 hypothetical protein BWG23_14955 [Flavobacterium oreochromis]
MNKARLVSNNEIVRADVLLELYPNYKELEFVCIDEKCSVRMAPACINKKDHRKPHFKKYRNREHIETCEYAIFNELHQTGQNQKLNNIQINKIGYPSVFNLNDDYDKVEEKKSSKARLDNEDEGITGNGGIKKVYEFDSENIKFDRNNKVQSIDRIVDWYLGFPYNRDVEIEIKGIKIEYRFFFKGIKDYTQSTELHNERIFYGRIMLSNKNRNAFDKYSESVYISLLGFQDKDKISSKTNNYSVKIDKNAISKNLLSRLKNKYNTLFEKAFTEFKNNTVEPNVALYAFLYGTIDNINDTILNVKQNHITFRYDKVRKTIIEE